MNLLEYINFLENTKPVTLIFEKAGYNNLLAFIENPQNNSRRNITSKLAHLINCRLTSAGAVVIPCSCTADPCSLALLKIREQTEKMGLKNVINFKEYILEERIC